MEMVGLIGLSESYLKGKIAILSATKNLHLESQLVVAFRLASAVGIRLESG